MVDDVTRAWILRRARDGRLLGGPSGYTLDRYPMINTDVTEEATAIAADGHLGPAPTGSAVVPLRRVNITAPGLAWLEAHDA